MKYIAGFMIIIIMVAMIIGLAFIGYFFGYKKSMNLWDQYNSNTDSLQKDDLSKESWGYFWMAIGVWAFDVLLLIGFLCSICVLGTAIKMLG